MTDFDPSEWERDKALDHACATQTHARKLPGNVIVCTIDFWAATVSPWFAWCDPDLVPGAPPEGAFFDTPEAARGWCDEYIDQHQLQLAAERASAPQITAEA